MTAGASGFGKSISSNMGDDKLSQYSRRNSDNNSDANSNGGDSSFVNKSFKQSQRKLDKKKAIP